MRCEPRTRPDYHLAARADQTPTFVLAHASRLFGARAELLLRLRGLQANGTKSGSTSTVLDAHSWHTVDPAQDLASLISVERHHDRHSVSRQSHDIRLASPPFCRLDQAGAPGMSAEADRLMSGNRRAQAGPDEVPLHCNLDAVVDRIGQKPPGGARSLRGEATADGHSRSNLAYPNPFSDRADDARTTPDWDRGSRAAARAGLGELDRQLAPIHVKDGRTVSAGFPIEVGQFTPA